MMRIYKYQLASAGYQEVKLPAGGKILSVAKQHGQLVMWARVNPAKPTKPRGIIIKGTGQPISVGELGEFIGTVLMEGGALVLHVFEAR